MRAIPFTEQGPCVRFAQAEADKATRGAEGRIVSASAGNGRWQLGKVCSGGVGCVHRFSTQPPNSTQVAIIPTKRGYFVGDKGTWVELGGVAFLICGRCSW